MKYLMAYFYDVPHSQNFVIEAKNKREAVRKARELLKNGRFDGLEGDSDDYPCREYVRVGERATESDADTYEVL